MNPSQRRKVKQMEKCRRKPQEQGTPAAKPPQGHPDQCASAFKAHSNSSQDDEKEERAAREGQAEDATQQQEDVDASNLTENVAGVNIQPPNNPSKNSSDALRVLDLPLRRLPRLQRRRVSCLSHLRRTPSGRTPNYVSAWRRKSNHRVGLSAWA